MKRFFSFGGSTKSSGSKSSISSSNSSTNETTPPISGTTSTPQVPMLALPVIDATSSLETSIQASTLNRTNGFLGTVTTMEEQHTKVEPIGGESYFEHDDPIWEFSQIAESLNAAADSYNHSQSTSNTQPPPPQQHQTTTSTSIKFSPLFQNMNSPPLTSTPTTTTTPSQPTKPQHQAKPLQTTTSIPKSTPQQLTTTTAQPSTTTYSSSYSYTPTYQPPPSNNMINKQGRRNAPGATIYPESCSQLPSGSESEDCSSSDDDGGTYSPINQFSKYLNPTGKVSSSPTTSSSKKPTKNMMKWMNQIPTTSYQYPQQPSKLNQSQTFPHYQPSTYRHPPHIPKPKLNPTYSPYSCDEDDDDVVVGIKFKYSPTGIPHYQAGGPQNNRLLQSGYHQPHQPSAYHPTNTQYLYDHHQIMHANEYVQGVVAQAAEPPVLLSERSRSSSTSSTTTKKSKRHHRKHHHSDKSDLKSHHHHHHSTNAHHKSHRHHAPEHALS